MPKKIKSKHSWDILNEIKWREDLDLSNSEVQYTHRGAPNDIKIIKGSDIRAIKKPFMLLDDETKITLIPYHRIVKIIYDGEVVFGSD